MKDLLEYIDSLIRGRLVGASLAEGRDAEGTTTIGRSVEVFIADVDREERRASRFRLQEEI